MALLMLPLVAFVAFRDGATTRIGMLREEETKQKEQQFSLFFENLRVINGTDLLLQCHPASILVRTHMAPDFENPQLVRKLNWLHDNILVASFQQQELGANIGQQLWVNDKRLQLKRPFFELRISPVLPKDNGEWICILETDPLFAEELPLEQAGSKLLVLEKPPIPPKPIIQIVNKNSVLIDWSKNYFPSLSEQPIIKFTIYISEKSEDDKNKKHKNNNNNFITTENNKTNIRINNINKLLKPNNLYLFSVRAENTVGESQFSPETDFQTFGLSPSKSPEIRSLKNSSSSDCINLEWQQPLEEEEESSNSIIGFRINITQLDSNNLKEFYVKGKLTQTTKICSLQPFTDYSLTLEANNIFGYSKFTKTFFKTDQSIPKGPPLSVQYQPLPGGNSLALNWRKPETPNGHIRAYLIYFKEMFSQKPTRLIRLEEKQQPSINEEIKLLKSSFTVFAFNLTNLLPNSQYKIQISAVTDKGEGPKSEPLIAFTDIEVPKNPPKIINLFFDCSNLFLSIEWILPEELLNLKNNNIIIDGFYKIEIYSFLTLTIKYFNISINSPSKLLLDQIQLGEQLSISITILLKSLNNSTILLESPSSNKEYFVLLANGWKCRYRSSICPLIKEKEEKNNLLNSKSSICENFAKSAVEQQKYLLLNNYEETTTLLTPFLEDNKNNKRMNANTATIFFIFGTAITLAIFLLFLCMLRSRCPLFKTFLIFHSNKKQQKRRPKLSENGKIPNGQERVSLVQKVATENDSILLPPITINEETFKTATFSSEKENKQILLINALQKNKEENKIINNNCEMSTTISVLEFDNYFEKMSANNNSGFKKQFNEIESETNLLLEDKNSEETINNEKSKNRYTDVCAFPKTSRIRLFDTQKLIERYINANFVDSCDETHAYIATQAPLPNTFGDFWLMVWQENCKLLIAITNMVECGRRKCDQYWPEEIESTILTDNNFIIKLILERSNSVFTHRIFEIKNNNIIEEEKNIRTIHQLHFMDWPDKEVPSTPFPFLHFINYVADLHCSSSSSSLQLINNNNISPCVVHCSAGIGRSGSFILVDSLRRHLLCCDKIDVEGQLKRMRKQRVQLVQTLEQYIFCHQVVKHLVSNGITRQPRTHFSNYCQFLFTKFTPTGQRRINAQAQTLLCDNKHFGGKELNIPLNNNNNIISLSGYHKNDEFLIIFNNIFKNGNDNILFKNWQNDIWQSIWKAKCKSLIILDSTFDLLDSNDCFLTNLFKEEQLFNEGGEEKDEFLIEKDIKNQQILIKSNKNEENEFLKINIQRIFTSKFLIDPWTEIEILQSKLKNQHREALAIIEIPRRERPTSAPFLFCALQSIACQLEQEDAVDVLLWLALYKNIYCCSWTNLQEIEMIYQRVLELVELQQTFC